MSVYAGRLCCARDHCLLLILGDMPPEQIPARAREQYAELVASGMVGPRCAECGSNDFHVEVESTPFATMKEAEASLHKTTNAIRGIADLLERIDQRREKARFN